MSQEPFVMQAPRRGRGYSPRPVPLPKSYIVGHTILNTKVGQRSAIWYLLNDYFDFSFGGSIASKFPPRMNTIVVILQF